MMNFGEGFGAVEASVGGGDKKYPELKGYVWVITGVDGTNSKVKPDGGGNLPMLRLDADIAEGEFTGFYSDYNKRLYQTFPDAAGQARLKGILEVIIAENPAMFPEAAIDWNTFEEKRLIGCTVGGVLKQDGKYSKLSYFCSKAKAAEAPVVEMVAEPLIAAKGSAGSDGGLF